MRALTMIGGILCILVVLLDAFQTIILPRRAAGRLRLTRIFYIATWTPWRFVALQIHHPRKRETVLSFYGPLSLIFLLVVWACGMVLGFSFLYYGLGSPFTDSSRQLSYFTDIYVSGTNFFTLGLGDVTPHGQIARVLSTLEAGTGFGFLAVIMGYFPVLYGAFSRREVSISLLDARAGSPPTAAELMRRHSFDGAENVLSNLLSEWERWSAELLESHISYTLLCYYRSQHTNQSWIGALTAILDTSALVISGVRGHEARQAQLTFAMARHAMVDLAQVFSLRPISSHPDRLPPERYEQLYQVLCQSGVNVCRDGQSYERLRNLRILYEGYAAALAEHLSMPLPPWIAEEAHKDNWLAVAKVRAQAESSETSTSEPHNLAEIIDQHHEF